MRGKYVIAGVGETRFGSLPGRSTYSLNIEAISLALGDAGIEKPLIDGLFVKYPTSQFEPLYAHRLAEALGLQPRVAMVSDQAGASNISLISLAAMSIENGQCDIAVVCFADNPKSGSRAAYARPRGDDAIFGLFGTAAGYALIAQRHMGQYGTTRSHLGEIAVAAREHGAKNPSAQLRKRLSLDDYMAEAPLVSPFCRHDCALVSDGGAAVVVMSAARARQLQVRAPVAILGFGQGHTAWDVAQRPDMTTTQAVASGATAFRMAGLHPRDIDVAQIYDCFTITPLMTLEDYGFCAKGSGGPFMHDIGIGLDGGLPMNTSGGLLSATGMPGMQLVIEGVRQVRQEANLQVPSVRNCLVSNQGGTMHTHSTLILGT